MAGAKRLCLACETLVVRTTRWADCVAWQRSCLRWHSRLSLVSSGIECQSERQPEIDYLWTEQSLDPCPCPWDLADPDPPRCLREKLAHATPSSRGDDALDPDGHPRAPPLQRQHVRRHRRAGLPLPHRDLASLSRARLRCGRYRRGTAILGPVALSAVRPPDLAYPWPSPRCHLLLLVRVPCPQWPYAAIGQDAAQAVWACRASRSKRGVVRL